MPSNLRPFALADPKRFKTIQDLTKMRPDCGASIDDILVIDHVFLLIIDFAHMGNILNPFNSPSAYYVRTHGVIVTSYIKNDSCSVIWNDPFLLLPMSHHLNGKLMGYTEVGKVVGDVFCPSGSFLLLSIRDDMPAPLISLMEAALIKQAGLKVELPRGTYRVFYEQFDVPEGSKKEYYQNIVVIKS